MIYNKIASGSKGNAVLYHNSILVDCGVSFSLLKPFLYQIQIVLATHKHLDHIDHSTLKKLCFERPSLRVGCPPWFVDDLHYVKNLDVYQMGAEYDYGAFKISPIKLYHDVENCGYRIFKDDYKIIHATDTSHLQGITAKDYDLYAIEHNYNQEHTDQIIESKETNGEFSHEKGAVNSHLSEQQAKDFIFENRKESSEVLRLHESTGFI